MENNQLEQEILLNFLSVLNYESSAKVVQQGNQWTLEKLRHKGLVEHNSYQLTQKGKHYLRKRKIADAQIMQICHELDFACVYTKIFPSREEV